MKRYSKFVATIAALLLAGCAGSHVVTGKVRAPIDVSQVTVYTSPPSRYEEIAIIDATSQLSLAITEQGNMDVVMQRLKERAASLGANSLRYLPVESIARAISFDADQLCQACITGEYPSQAGQDLYQIALQNVDAPKAGRTYESKPVPVAARPIG